MPRYFFHTHVGADVVADPVGTDLRDPDAAWTTARDTIRTMMAEPRNQARLMGAILVVADAEGEVILEFPFAEAMAGPGDDSVH
ncbi:DUF6894 family protein [Methylobacterium goesingense]|uniref:DUF6894 domain-containing protein n=1 Tax=Methylobacterium goesingense TaxID=243690 RepID=A0ABV2L0Z8_9HYPH|nr:hypothetical protein [Methylobacterium goesingense]GJD75894.1 hypothetical protein CFIICLFH_4140 [Methylobacterium goesingense]